MERAIPTATTLAPHTQSWDRFRQNTPRRRHAHGYCDVADLAEVKKCFRIEIPVKERSAWEDLFTSGKAEIARLSTKIKRNEVEINAIVYKLFDLSAEEIELLETSIGVK